jgi:hypothetical protein
MRRVHIRGDLVLDDGGWSSGGFLADSKVDGEVRSGASSSGSRENSELGSWKGANWNIGDRRHDERAGAAAELSRFRRTPRSHLRR